MSPIDGPIGLKMNINLPQAYSDNISGVQPSKANGLGGVRLPTFRILLYSYLDQLLFGWLKRADAKEEEVTSQKNIPKAIF